MSRPDPRIITRTAVEVLQTMCTFLDLRDLASLAQTCKCIGDQILYGTDERSVRTAGMILWRNHPQHARLMCDVTEFRPLRALLSSNPTKALVHSLFYNMQGWSFDKLVLFEKHKHHITIGAVADEIVSLIAAGCIDKVLEMFPNIVSDASLLYDVLVSHEMIPDNRWIDVTKLIKAGANTEFIAPFGRDLNDIARQYRCYDKYRLAIKRSKASAASEQGRCVGNAQII